MINKIKEFSEMSKKRQELYEKTPWDRYWQEHGYQQAIEDVINYLEKEDKK